MKKLLLMMLALMLLLGGCAQPENPEETNTQQTATEATIPGLYVPQSALEQASGGAVRQYALPGESYSWLTMLDGKLLLAASGGETALTLLAGEDAVPSDPVTVSTALTQGTWQIVSNGFAYYDQPNGQVVHLDNRLQELRRVALPADMQGMPVIAPDGKEIFYCVGQELRAFELERGIWRMVKSHTCTSLRLTGSYFDGRLLACQASYDDGTENILYVSSENGETLHNYNYITELTTLEGNFFARRTDGTVEQIFFGTEDGTAQQLNVTGGKVAQALALNGAVQYAQAEDGALSLAFYDLTSGKKTSAVTLTGVSEPKAFLADKAGFLWMLTADTETGKEILLRWDIKKTAVQDETVYTGTFYTAKNPDEAGIKACRTRANKLDKTYGIKLRLWEYAAKYTGGHEVIPEHQPAAINRCLDELVPILKEFPDKFLKKAISSGVRVCVVRSIDGEQKCVQFWEGDSFFILVSVGADLRQGIMSCLGYVIDTHILGNSSRYDYWKPLNPEGFDYADPATHLESYLSGENRAFADAESMASVRDDRSRMFYYAMLPNNAEMFKSETMQKKLRLLCKGIRNAWDWRREETEFPWEQYLNESIAYKK